MKQNFEMLPNKPAEEEVNLQQYLALLWSKRGWLFLVTALCCGLSILVSQSIRPVYRADSLVQIEGKSPGFSLSEGVSELLETDSQAITEIELIRSRLVLGSVVDDKNLVLSAAPLKIPAVHQLLEKLGVSMPAWGGLKRYARGGESITVDSLRAPELFESVSLTVTKLNETDFQVSLPEDRIQMGTIGAPFTDKLSGIQFVVTELKGEPGRAYSVSISTRLAAIAKVRSNLSVSEIKRGSNLIRVSLESHDPARAEVILSGIMQAYVAQNIGRSAAEATRSHDFLLEQLPLVKQELARAEAQLNDYRLQNDSIDINLETQSVLNQIVELDAQLNELSLQETELAQRYTANHPKYASLLAMRSQLNAKKNAINNSIKQLPARQQEVLRKNRDVEVTQHIYVQLVTSAPELDVLMAGVVGNVRIIDTAAALPRPVKPKPLWIVALVTLAGTMLASLLVLVRSTMAREIDSPVDLEKLGVPVYATIPYSQGQTRLVRSNFQGSSGILARDFPTEMSVEAIRNLRTSLHFGMLDKQSGVVAITGPSPEIGKSFVTLNVGYLAAQAGANVLIVDADLRRGNLGKVFQLNRGTLGLSDILSGASDWQQVIKTASVESLHNAPKKTEAERFLDKAFELAPKKPSFGRTSGEAVAAVSAQGESATIARANAINDRLDNTIPPPVEPTNVAQQGRLSIVPRGKAPPNPSELLMHGRFADFVSTMSQRFDLVLIDTPPVLAATDALIISRYTDMNLVVVRHGHTTVGELEQVTKMFQQNQTSITGVILNNYDPRKGKYGAYGETYGYQYNYH